MLKSSRALIANDTHIPFEDKNSVKILLKFAKDYQPDEIFLLGDVIDLWIISTFLKDPSRKNTIQSDINKARDFLSNLRTSCPNSIIHYIFGNHEFRMKKYVWDKAKELANLDSMKLSFLLGLDKLNIKYYDSRNAYIKKGNIILTHGTVVSQDSAMTARRMLKKFGLSVMHGHSHRGGNTFTTDMLGTRGAWENFCLCDMSLSEDWGHSIPNWQHGFSTIDFIKDRFYVQQVPIIKNKCLYGNKVYTAE